MRLACWNLASIFCKHSPELRVPGACHHLAQLGANVGAAVSHETLCMDTAICISYHFHVSLNIILLTFFQSFINVKTNPSSWAVHKQGGGPGTLYKREAAARRFQPQTTNAGRTNAGRTCSLCPLLYLHVQQDPGAEGVLRGHEQTSESQRLASWCALDFLLWGVLCHSWVACM